MQAEKAASVITVMLVDDHAVVRQGIESFLSLQEDICVVAQAASGGQAIELAAEYVPDVILMDLIMPGGEMGGVEATRVIKEMSPHTQIIVLTSYHNDEHIFPSIRAGALSYILKEVDASDLVDIIRMATRGEAHMSPQVASRLMLDIEQSDSEGLNNKLSPMTLTDREQQVLQAVAEGLSNAEICEQFSLSIKTVRTHVSNILSKLHLRDRTQVAIYAWRKGFVK